MAHIVGSAGSLRGGPLTQVSRVGLLALDLRLLWFRHSRLAV